MLVDFHCHSNCSDGELSPMQLIEIAQEKSIKCLAITDHDTIDAYYEIENIDKHLLQGIKLISGVEFSTIWDKIGVHIVALDFDLHSEPMLQAIQKQESYRKNRAKVISQKLEKHGLINAYKKITANNNRQIGRPDFAKLLVEEGICKNFQEAFKKYLGAGKVGDVKSQWLSLEQVITTISKAKGIPVLAHPLAYKLTNSKLKRLLKDFKSFGGQSIEVINGYQNLDKINYLQNLCKEFNLLASIGSDFHRNNNWTKLGCNTDLISGVEKVWDSFKI